MKLTEAELKGMNYHRNQVVLSENEKLVGSDGDYYQNVVKKLAITSK